MIDSQSFNFKPLLPFGVELSIDLNMAMDDDQATAFRNLFHREKLVIVRGQMLSEDDQVRVISYIGKILGAKGEYRELSSDGNLGAGPLCYHSDLSFTAEPFKALSLFAIDVVEGQSYTRFANGIRALDKLSADLRAKLSGMNALALISAIQTHRAVPYSASDFFPQQDRPAIITHPETGEQILYVTEMQTARIGDLPKDDSDALLQQLFDVLYAPNNVYEHVWRTGDLVIWDNLALQHSRPDLSNCHPRRLQRIAIADKSFFDLCPQFTPDDPRVRAWGNGDTQALEAAEALYHKEKMDV